MPDIHISPHGDMIISLPHQGEFPARFLVSSTALCAASPVFAAMLGPSSSFSEAVSLRSHKAIGNDLYVQKLTDDDPVALAVVLNAMHLQTLKVPRKVSVQQLMQLAIFCDKYDCAAVVKPWVASWESGWTKSTVLNTQLQRLFIAWVFGVEAEFELLTHALVSKIAFEDDEALVGGKKKKKVCGLVKSSEGKREWLMCQLGEYAPSVVFGKLLLSSLVDWLFIDTG